MHAPGATSPMPSSTAADHRVRGVRVDLPERLRGQVPLAACGLLVGGAAAQRGVADALEQLGGVHLARGVPDDLDLRGRRPLPLQHGQERPRRGDRAVADREHLVAAVRPQARPPVVGDGHPHPGAPVQGPAGQLLDGDLALDPGQAGELLGDDDRLEVALQGRLGVLPVAAAAAAGSRPRAGRLDALRRRDEHRDRVGAAERAAGVLGDRRPHPLAGQRVAHEDHAPLVARDAVAPVRDRPDVEVEQLVGPVGPDRHGDGRLGGPLGGRAHRGRAGVSSRPPAERRDGERPAVAGLGGGTGAGSAGPAGPPAPGGGS